LSDGRVLYEFRRPRPDGSTHVVLEPVEFLEKLAALVPPPRSHLVRYHGVLAPNARRRRGVVPKAAPEGSRPRRPCSDELLPQVEEGASGKSRWRERMRWADLLKRTLGIDVLSCPRCGGRMEAIAEITDPEVVGKVLRAMGLSVEAPRASSARPPPQGEFDFDQAG
ncbi:MAG TPA: transposase, partial [Planctomycetota bacterium]|nr:transposase [Planctomycetota bacterium]